MMIRALGKQGDTGHEAEGAHEIPELDAAADAARIVGEAPVGQRGQRLCAFLVGEPGNAGRDDLPSDLPIFG